MKGARVAPARRYVSSLDSQCVVLPVTPPVGTQITISGLLEARLATDGLAPTVTEDCFNVEAFGLSADPGEPFELNLLDPANVINDQGFGLFWEMADTEAQPTENFIVTGCGAGVRCKLPTPVYNTDTGLTDSTGCVVLAPLS